MQVSVETTEGLQRRMTVQVPSERIDKEVDQRLQSMAGRVRLDGFRPGKVPFRVVKQRFGESVRGEVLSEVLQQTYGEALNQEKLRPAGSPEIDTKQIDAGKDLEYVATFEVLPEFEVKGVEGVKVTKPAVEIKDSDVDEVLERLQKQRAEYEKVDRKAGDADRVVVDFVGKIDGEEFSGNKGEDVPVTIGSGQMPPEFEDGLKGVKAGEEKDLEYTFPENFPDKEVAEKTATFHVTVKEVQEAKLPPIDDEFAKLLGIDEGLDAVKTKIRENLERERDHAVRGKLKKQIMDALYEANQIDLPKVLIDGEISVLQNQMKEQMKQYGQEASDDLLPAAMFEDQARRRVTLGLVVNEIVRANEIKLDQDRLRAALENAAAGYERPQEVMQYYAQNRQLMEGLEISVIEDQVVDWVAERAKVTEESTDFQTLMEGDRAAPEESEE